MKTNKSHILCTPFFHLGLSSLGDIQVKALVGFASQIYTSNSPTQSNYSLSLSTCRGWTEKCGFHLESFGSVSVINTLVSLSPAGSIVHFEKPELQDCTLMFARGSVTAKPNIGGGERKRKKASAPSGNYWTRVIVWRRMKREKCVFSSRLPLLHSRKPSPDRAVVICLLRHDSTMQLQAHGCCEEDVPESSTWM